MCVIRWHAHKNRSCHFITDISRCSDYNQHQLNNPNKVFDEFISTLCITEGYFRKQLDSISYTTAPRILIMRAYLHPCKHAKSVEMEGLAEVCPFCDDVDVKRQLEQLENKGVSGIKQEMGEKEGEIGREGKEE